MSSTFNHPIKLSASRHSMHSTSLSFLQSSLCNPYAPLHAQFALILFVFVCFKAEVYTQAAIFYYAPVSNAIDKEMTYTTIVGEVLLLCSSLPNRMNCFCYTPRLPTTLRLGRTQPKSSNSGTLALLGQIPVKAVNLASLWSELSAKILAGPVCTDARKAYVVPHPLNTAWK